MKKLNIILGNQLFDYKYYRDLSGMFFMCEDISLCSHFKYHKHKIIHFLASMRFYRNYLIEKNRQIEYFEIACKPQFFEQLQSVIKKKRLKNLFFTRLKIFSSKNSLWTLSKI